MNPGRDFDLGSGGSGAGLDQRRRLAELERHQQKLIDAYMADALPVEALKERQGKVGVEIADAKRLIQSAQTASDEVFARLEEVIALLRQAHELYATCGPESRQVLNSAVFEAFYVDSQESDSVEPHVTSAPLTPIVDAVLAPAGPGSARTLGKRSLAEGSNVTHLAGGGGGI